MDERRGCSRNSEATGGGGARHKMQLEIAVAGAICLILGASHAAIGSRGVLPHLTKDNFSSTWFGPRSLTAGMVRFTWHMTTIVLLGFAVLLNGLAFAPDVDARILVLRWVAGMWLVATPFVLFVAGSPRRVLRFPMALLIPLVAVLCWLGAS